MTAATITRNATVHDLTDILRSQQARRVDVVAPASQFRMSGGVLVVRGTDAVLDENGVTVADGSYRPTVVFDEGVAGKLGIPLAFLRNLRQTRVDLYDQLVNGLLHGRTRRHADGTVETIYPADARRFMLRLFRGDDGQEGVARALLSDSYKIIQNLDVLMSILDGIREAGVDIEVQGCDLTERRMYVRIAAPAVAMAAPALLKDYRSPFSGQSGNELPIIHAGIVASNSETGGGAFTVAPRITMLVCKNGMTVSRDIVRAVHLGAKLEEGLVQWSADTQEKNLALVQAKARDAVKQFLTPGYLEQVVTELERQAGVEVEKPAETIKFVSQKLAYSQDEQDAILNMFTRSGQVTAGGVMQAVTAYAQTVPDADRAAELEDSALQALAFAARR